jgi:hypothetical protein
MSLLSLFQNNLSRLLSLAERNVSDRNAHTSKARKRDFDSKARIRLFASIIRQRDFVSGDRSMSKNFGIMAPATSIRFSLDMAGMIPAGEMLLSADVNIRSGQAAVTITDVGVDLTKVYFKVNAISDGDVKFDVIGAFSDGTTDGEDVILQIK